MGDVLALLFVAAVLVRGACHCRAVLQRLRDMGAGHEVDPRTQACSDLQLVSMCVGVQTRQCSGFAKTRHSAR